MYTSATLGTAFTFTLAPLFFEYAAESVYPAPEGMVGGILTLFYNLVGCVFLCIFFIPDIGTLWMNYVMVIGTLMCIPAVLLTQESYNRLNLDLPDRQRESKEEEVLKRYTIRS